MANLYLTCKSCGKSFFSGVMSPPPEPRAHECTWCHDAPVYEVTDFYVPYSDADLDAAAGAHHG